MSSGQGQMLLMCSNVKDQMQVAKHPFAIFSSFFAPQELFMKHYSSIVFK